LWLLLAAWAACLALCLAGFLLGILESFASLQAVIEAVPGINQIIIYLVAILILLTRPRGLMGRKGVMED
jgi:branched-chain amino acid transport system permease protein